LAQPTAGRVLLDGHDVTSVHPALRDIAMVFQNYALYPHMSVFDNMAYGLRIRGLARADIRRRVDEAPRLLGIGDLLGRKRLTVRAEIRRLQRRLGFTTLFVTYDQVEAIIPGDRLLVLHRRRPAQLATPMEVFAQPADT
jgi:sn-glycerol 3-phosphate transport system ATP-binding protein